MFVYFCGKIVDKRADLPAYLNSPALSAYLRVIKMKVNKKKHNKKNLEINTSHTLFIDEVEKGRKNGGMMSCQFLACVDINPNTLFSPASKCTSFSEYFGVTPFKYETMLESLCENNVLRSF